jgi:DNA-directed RNA polymerase subunit RPC12/RpoP
MDFNCSHCSQPLSIADEEIAALRGRASIACPSCGGKIVLPKPQRSLAPSPVRAPGQLKPVPHAPAAAPAKAAKPAKPKKPRLPIDPAKLQRNILILGCTALLMLGGIAGFLATREAGKTVHIEQKIINKLIENEYFQRLIRDGL